MRLAALSCLLFIQMSSSYAFTFTAPDGFNSPKKKEVLSVQKCNELADIVEKMSESVGSMTFTLIPAGTELEDPLRRQCLDKSDKYLFHYSSYYAKMAFDAIKAYNESFYSLKNSQIPNVMQRSAALKFYLKSPHLIHKYAVRDYYTLADDIAMLERTVGNFSALMRSVEAPLDIVFKVRETLEVKIDNYIAIEGKEDNIRRLTEMYEYVQRAEHYADRENIGAKFSKIIDSIDRLNNEMAEHSQKLKKRLE